MSQEESAPVLVPVAPSYCLDELDTSSSANEGRVMIPLHPVTNEPLPFRLLIAGEDGEPYAKAMDAVARRSIKKSKGGQKSDTDSAFTQLREGGLTLCCHITLDWWSVSPEDADDIDAPKTSNTIIIDGRELPCNAPNRRTVFSRMKWLADQASDFSRDRSVFLTT